MKSIILSFTVGLMASAAFLLSSCQDEELGYTAEQIAYRTNFEKSFGKIKDIPTFDMSSYNLNRLGLQGGPKYTGITRAAGDNVYSVVTGDSHWFQVPSKLGQWMDDNLKEGNNNKNQGTTQFKLFMPDHDILIIPVYQGEAGMEWELYLSDEDNEIPDTKIWSKSELMKVSVGGSYPQVGETKTTTLNSSPALSFQEIKHGENSHKSLMLENAIPADFDPQTEWLQITLSNINAGNGSNGAFYIGNENLGQIENLTSSIEIKDVAKLQAIKNNPENFCFSMWWSPTEFTRENNPDISVTVKRFSTSGSDNWVDVSSLGKGNPANTIGKKTQSQAIRINHEAFSGTFSLYLKVTNRDESFWEGNKWGDYYASKEDMSSKDGQMVILNVLNDPTIGADLKQSLINAFGDQQMYRNICMLGCEDSDMTKNGEGWGSDWDMNDISFFVVGMPMENIVGKDDEIIKKRYMIEDLGSTFDFDFNDIVVDVTRIKSFSEDGTLVRWTETAELKHLCGTIPFQIGFVNNSGDKWFGIMPGQNDGAEKGGVGHTPTEAIYQEMLVSDNLTSGTMHYWDPDHNNIRVRVWPKAAGLEPENLGEQWTDEQIQWILSTGGDEFGFPDKDIDPAVKIPYIIACDQSIHWQPELTTIPNDWFRTWHREVEKKACNISLDVRSLQLRPNTTSAEYTIDSNSTGDISISPATNNGVTATLVGKKIQFTASADAQSGTTATFTVHVAETSTISAGTATITVSVVDKLNPQLKVNNNAVTISANNYLDISYGSESQGAVSVDMKDGSSSNITVAIVNNNIRITVAAGATNGETATIVVSQVAEGEYLAADNVEIAVTVQVDGDVLPWTGSKTINWNDSKLFFNKSYFAGIQAGDQVVIEHNNSGKLQLNVQNTDTHLVEFTDNETYVYTIPADKVDEIKNNGLFIQGQDVIVTSVRLVTPVPETGGTIDFNTSGLGTEFTGTFTPKTYESMNYHQISLKDVIGTYNGTDDIIVNFVMPANSSLNGKFGGSASGWFQQEDNSTISNSSSEPAVISVRLSDLTGSVANNYKNADGNIVFDIYSTSSCTVDRDKAASVRIFVTKEAAQTYTITGATNNASYGSVSVSNASVASGGSVTLTATPTSGYRFVKWQDENTTNPRTITNVTADATYTATFEVVPTYSLTLIATDGQGTVSGAGTYQDGETVNISAAAASGYRFVGWRDENGTVSMSNSITMNGSNLTLTAVFEEYSGKIIWNGTASNQDLTDISADVIQAYMDGYTKMSVEFSGSSNDSNIWLRGGWHNELVRFTISDSLVELPDLSSDAVTHGSVKLTIPYGYTVTMISMAQ